MCPTDATPPEMLAKVCGRSKALITIRMRVGRRGCSRYAGSSPAGCTLKHG